MLLGDYSLAIRNLAEHPTTLRYDGPASLGTILLVEDTEYPPTATAFPAAIAGWIGGTVPGVTTGVYGWTGVSGGAGALVAPRSWMRLELVCTAMLLVETALASKVR